MGGELLAEHYRKYFSQQQPELFIKEEILEEVVFVNPFLTVDSLWEDIKPSIKSDKFYAVSLVGPQGKGKTFLGRLFGTKAEDDGFLVIYAKAEDVFLNQEEWVRKVKVKLEEWDTDKLCIIFDDMSYSNDSVSKKNSAKFKHFVADVRHVFEDKEKHFNPSVFMVYISHRLHSLPPMLRNSGSWIFTSMQSADRDDAMKVITKRKEMQEKLEIMYEFISKVSIDGPKAKKLKFTFGKHNMDFLWGTEENTGDGRLMVCNHAGDLKIFNSKAMSEMIDIESDLYRIKYIPPPTPTPEELEAQKEKKKEALRIEADKLFSIKTEF